MEYYMSKILVIEDDPSVRASLKELLSEEGHSIFEAEDGRKGFKAAQDYLPDLIISDILMPEMDGYRLLKELQKEVITSGIPFIFLSAKTDLEDIRCGMNLGADDYLTKPYKAEHLISAVNSKLERRKYFEKKFDNLYSNIAKSLPHEMRTPLVAIIGFSQLILEQAPRLDRYEIIEMAGSINKAGNNLLKIIKKFLLYSDLELINLDKDLKKLFANNKPVNAREIYSFVKPVIEQYKRDEDIIMHLEDVELKIEESHIKFITEELADNACKFSKPGSKIYIDTRIENGFLIFTIKDCGIGMSVDQIKDIGTMRQFDREKNFQNGLGLSLAIIRKLTDLYNGVMSIESIKGEYTVVKILFEISKKKN